MHRLLSEFLDGVLKPAIVLGGVLLLLVHKKLLGVIKRWKQTLSRSPTQATPATATTPTTTPPRPPVPQRPTSSASTAEGTPAGYFPASERRPAATTPSLNGPRFPTRPVILFRRHRPGLNKTRGGPSRRPLLASVSSSSSSSATEKPWERHRPKKTRKKGRRVLDLREFSDEVIWAAGKLLVPTIRQLLSANGIPFDEELAMPTDKKCELLAALLERVDVDVVKVYRDQEVDRKRLPATKEEEEGAGEDEDSAAGEDTAADEDAVDGDGAVAESELLEF